MLGLLRPLYELTQTTVAGGYLVAMAGVCLLQYVYFVSRQHRARRQNRLLRREAEGLNVEVLQLSRERNLQRVENQLLREVLSHTESAKAVQGLLRRYIPNTEEAFAVFLPCDAYGGEVTVQSRGLSAESLAALHCDPDLLDELHTHGTLIWDPPSPARCPFYNQLSLADRRKARQLFAFAVADEAGILSVLICTSLLPIAALRQDQVDLTQRLLSSLAPSLRYNLNLERQTTQLRSTREMLELRSIIDGEYDQPFGMLERFLTRLGQLLEAERVALFVSSRDGSGQLKPLVRCGVQLQQGVVESWLQHELRLAQQAVRDEHLLVLDRPQLLRFGVDTLIGSAACTPIAHQDKSIGAVCITRRSSTNWSPAQQVLITWAGETISRTFDRVMSFAVIERQARQDGLTGLANRRTFDAQLQSEVAALREGALVECSLLLLDLDRFKQVNDMHGHQAGDEVLRSTGRVLKDQAARMRSHDRLLLARYGGEELAVLMPGVGVHGARRVAEDIRLAIEEHTTTFNGKTIRATVSIGVASGPAHGLTPESLIAAADGALYQAKSTGRNRVVCAVDPLEEQMPSTTRPALPAKHPGRETIRF